MSKLLFDEHPIIANKTLAREIGLIESIVLQKINYWLEMNKQIRKNYQDGRFWTYNSIINWQEKILIIWVLIQLEEHLIN